MGTFRTKKLLSGNPSLIPNISHKIEQEFKMDNYEVMVQDLANGGKEVSLTKGGIFMPDFKEPAMEFTWVRFPTPKDESTQKNANPYPSIHPSLFTGIPCLATYMGPPT